MFQETFLVLHFCGFAPGQFEFFLTFLGRYISGLFNPVVLKTIGNLARLCDLRKAHLR